MSAGNKYCTTSNHTRLRKRHWMMHPRVPGRSCRARIISRNYTPPVCWVSFSSTSSSACRFDLGLEPACGAALDACICVTGNEKHLLMLPLLRPGMQECRHDFNRCVRYSAALTGCVHVSCRCRVGFSMSPCLLLWHSHMQGLFCRWIDDAHLT